MNVEIATAPQSVANIAVSLIDAGKNPRSRFEPRAMAQLTETIRAQGLLQGILLRPSENGRFAIVAGERRFRAFTTIFGMGQDVFIPALIREMTDAEAERYALTENVEREQMTPVEEAESASRVLGDCNGDRDEAARVMGWERKFLDRRIALMYAIAEVRQALQESKILLGHAELLAGLRKESQLQVLGGLLAATPMPTVTLLKDRLEKAALPFSKAIFDKTECTQCQHNTANQQSLFSAAVQEGNCTNKPCYERKSEEELNVRAKALEGDYQVVRIIRPGDNFTIVQLQADGIRGVGVEQAIACRTCKDFGAVVNGLPDKRGEVFKGMCMNTACNTTKVAARINAEKEIEAAAAKASSDVEAAESKSKKNGSKGSAEKGTGSLNGSKRKAELPAVASSVPSTALKEYREKVWRSVLGRAITRLDADTSLCVLIALAAYSPRVIDSSAFKDACQAAAVPLKNDTISEIGGMLASALALDGTALKKALHTIPACLSTSMEIREIVSLLNGLDVKLEDHWKVNDEFFSLLTKNEVDATCGEIGIKDAIGASYSKLIGGKKDDLVKTILSVPNFHYEGCIPKKMRW